MELSGGKKSTRGLAVLTQYRSDEQTKLHI